MLQVIVKRNDSRSSGPWKEAGLGRNMLTRPRGGRKEKKKGTKTDSKQVVVEVEKEEEGDGEGEMKGKRNG